MFLYSLEKDWTSFCDSFTLSFALLKLVIANFNSFGIFFNLEALLIKYFARVSISINENLNNQKNIKEKTCPICLDEIRNDDYVKLLCGHRYHHDCVKNDYTFRKCKDYQCAVCRSKIHPISLNL